MNHDVDLSVWSVEDQLSMLLTLNEDLRAAAEEAEAACAQTNAEEAAAARPTGGNVDLTSSTKIILLCKQLDDEGAAEEPLSSTVAIASNAKTRKGDSW